MCDCGAKAAGKTDSIVVATVSSADEGFNSFHCFVDGANVCGALLLPAGCMLLHSCALLLTAKANPGWGSNTGNKGDGGGCWFVIPAGSTYNCSMQVKITSHEDLYSYEHCAFLK